MEGSGSGFESVQIINDSDPGMPKNLRILRVRIRNTGSLQYIGTGTYYLKFTFTSQIAKDKWLALGNFANQPPVAPSFDLVLHRAEKRGIFIYYNWE